MKLRWNAKGDSVSTMVLWVGTLIAVFICIAWLIKNFNPDHLVLQQVDNELTNLQKNMNTACRMNNYWKNHYPKMNQGNLILSDLQICIDSAECRVVYYKSNSTEPEFIGNDIVLNNSYPCNYLEQCSSLYYSSENTAEFQTDRMVILNATTCINQHIPIVRCRLLMCNINSSEYINLDEVTLINITKNSLGVFSFVPE